MESVPGRLCERRGAVRTLAGRYRLHRPIGVGGMGVVWLAHDQTLDRKVAVKTLTPQADVDRRALTEALAAARLSHPNIASIYDFGRVRRRAHPPTPYLVMEFVAGETLAGRFKRGWRPSLDM